MADEANPSASTATAEKPAVKPTPRDESEKEVGKPQRKKKSVPKYNDYEEDEEDEEPEFKFPHRQGKHRMMPARVSRIADRPMNGNEPTISVKIELDLEVEVEIYVSASVGLR
ncbi:hypothetical protein EG327_002430 [Venturia inaequalis]|uniref:Uncharacterized protein n=1 Tax=Venturia inaequalis TaxID=5025 RepID=A0A8H3ZDU9_VENIN|nr:hypothetical protein EG327_002430 [Venturia inaequalis]